MTLKPTFIVLILLSHVAGYAQPGAAEKSAIRHMEKQRWQKAESRLRKSLARDAHNPSVRYVLSVFYFDSRNPAFDLDSAYRYVVGALNDLTGLPPRDRARLQRGGIDSLLLVNHRTRIDSTAFEIAREKNTEAAYLEFLSNFPSSVQRELAVQLRDEVAYEEALRENTHEAFYRYFTRYPQARRTPEAKAHYHRLLYLERTQDKRLASFEKFLEEYPETPYRREIYQNILEIVTADGTVESLLAFMRRCPVEELAKKAADIAFHLLAEEEDPQWPEGFLTDSMRSLLAINNTYLVPFLKEDRFGFMDEHGREVVAPKFTEIHHDYLCGQVTDELLVADHQLVARNGSVVFRGEVDHMTDIGAGFLKIETAGLVHILHKSGFLLAENVTDAHIIAGSFIAVRKDNPWFLYTLTGRLLDDRGWEAITAIGDVVVFSDGGQKFVIGKHDLSRGAEGDPLPLSKPFDELRPWQDGLIWGRSGEFEGVLDQSLNGVVRFDRHALTPTFFGAIATAPHGVVVYNPQGRKSTVFDQVQLLAKNVGVKKGGRWFLYDPVAHVMKSRSYDSLRAEGAFVVGIRGDSVYVHFSGERYLPLYRPGNIAFVPGRNATPFLAIEQRRGREKTVYDLEGRKLFSAAFDALEYAGDGLFVVTRKDRKGLVDSQGKQRLRPEYDAIGTVSDGVVSLLRNKQFGAYHTRNGKLIRPQYDRNLISYGSAAVITYKDGKYGFLDWGNKPVSELEFEEISYWNDSLALVRKEALWNLYDLKAKKMVETNLRSVRMIRDTPDRKLAIVQRGNDFGVISNEGKVVLPPTFSEVVNLGSADAPLYFTEKHVPEASLHIVIYYDRNGEMIRKEIYDNAADYDRIFCSHK